MKARVSADCKLSVVQSAGIIFTTQGWTDVPQAAEREIINNPYLVTDREIIDDDAPAQPVDNDAVKLVDTRQARAKGKRKL